MMSIIAGIMMSVVILVGTPALSFSADDIDALITKLKDSDEVVVENAEQALIRRGSASVDPVVLVLQDNDPQTRGAAVRILGAIGTPASSALIGILDHAEWRVRMGVARALGKIKDRAATNPLVSALGDEHQGVRAAAASALGVLGDPKAIGPLSNALQDKATVVRMGAARGLGKLGDAGAVNALLEAIQEPGRVRRTVVQALAAIGAPAVEPMGALLTDQNTDPGVRVALAEAFEQMRAAESAVPLSIALHDADRTVRKVAADALVLLGPPAVVPVRGVLLQNPDTTARVLAAGVLTEASRQANRPWAQGALAALIMGLKDDDANVRAAASVGIGRFRFQALEQLYVGLKEDHSQFRTEIINILADMGHPLSIRHLEHLLTIEQNPEVRNLAESAIERIKVADTLTPNTPEFKSELK